MRGTLTLDRTVKENRIASEVAAQEINPTRVGLLVTFINNSLAIQKKRRMFNFKPKGSVTSVTGHATVETLQGQINEQEAILAEFTNHFKD